jgi:hypothetical protein
VVAQRIEELTEILVGHVCYSEWRREAEGLSWKGRVR